MHKGARMSTPPSWPLISYCLSQVDSPQTLHNFKLFFEAFLGFYKLHGPNKG